MKFRKKPVVSEAVQWFKAGDVQGVEPRFLMPGAPAHISNEICAPCRHKFSEHGSIETLEGHHIVCPGDWIITGVKGEKYPCKPDIFEMTYDPVVALVDSEASGLVTPKVP